MIYTINLTKFVKIFVDLLVSNTSTIFERCLFRKHYICFLLKTLQLIIQLHGKGSTFESIETFCNLTFVNMLVILW